MQKSLSERNYCKQLISFYLLDLEWMLFQVGAIKSEMEEKPRKEINDVLNSAIKQSAYNDNSDDDNDWW